MLNINISKNGQLSHIAVGGTFDHLHKGHKKLLDTAFKVSRIVTIGLTADNLTKSKVLSSAILAYEMRKKELINYLEEKKYMSRSKIIKLNDVYGIAVADKTLEGIIVTTETKANALKINQLRVADDLPPLKVIQIQYEGSAKTGIISSTRIRLGEIDRDGKVYSNVFTNTLILPSYMRHELRKPLGVLIEGSEEMHSMVTRKVIAHIKKMQPPVLISVGDVSSQSLVDAGFIPQIQVVDFKTKRMPLPQLFKKIYWFHNKAGTISHRSFGLFRNRIQKFFKNNIKTTIYVKGEEDLLVLPAIMAAPLKSIIVYGQFDKGVVIVDVDEIIKSKVMQILYRFENVME